MDRIAVAGVAGHSRRRPEAGFRKTYPQSAFSARSKSERVTDLVEQLHGGMCRLGSVSGRNGGRAGPAAPHLHDDQPLDRRRAPLRLLDRTRDYTPTIRRPTLVVCLPQNVEAGCETLPTGRRLHICLSKGRIGWPTRAKDKVRTTGGSTGLTSFAIAWEILMALAKTWRGRRGCAGERLRGKWRR